MATPAAMNVFGAMAEATAVTTKTMVPIHDARRMARPGGGSSSAADRVGGGGRGAIGHRGQPHTPASASASRPARWS